MRSARRRRRRTLVLRAQSAAERELWVERITATVAALGEAAATAPPAAAAAAPRAPPPGAPVGGGGGSAAVGDFADAIYGRGGVLFDGFLRKKRAASGRNTWDRRYAILTPNVLAYADKKAAIGDPRSRREIDLSRFTYRLGLGEDGTHVIELYCPYERAYHLRGDSDGATQAWADAISKEQSRVARMAVERHKLDGRNATEALAMRTARLTTPDPRAASLREGAHAAAEQPGAREAGAGAAADADGRRRRHPTATPCRAPPHPPHPPPLPSDQILRQQGHVKYGWVDERAAATSASGRRQWLVLRDDGLLLFYRKAKDAQPCKVLFAHEHDGHLRAALAALALAAALAALALVALALAAAAAGAAGRPHTSAWRRPPTRIRRMCSCSTRSTGEADEWLRHLRDVAARVRQAPRTTAAARSTRWRAAAPPRRSSRRRCTCGGGVPASRLACRYAARAASRRSSPSRRARPRRARASCRAMCCSRSGARPRSRSRRSFAS